MDQLRPADFGQQRVVGRTRMLEQGGAGTGNGFHARGRRAAREPEQPGCGRGQMAPAHHQRVHGVQQHARHILQHARHAQGWHGGKADAAGIAERCCVAGRVLLDQRYAKALAHQRVGTARPDNPAAYDNRLRGRAEGARRCVHGMLLLIGSVRGRRQELWPKLAGLSHLRVCELSEKVSEESVVPSGAFELGAL